MNNKDKKITYLLMAIAAGLILLALLALLRTESLTTKDIRPISSDTVNPPGSSVKIGNTQ
jgi:heme/copper-type cytochrome/quinol oxidase subunit 1